MTDDVAASEASYTEDLESEFALLTINYEAACALNDTLNKKVHALKHDITSLRIRFENTQKKLDKYEQALIILGIEEQHVNDIILDWYSSLD